MDPITLELLTTIGMSVLVSVCGLGAVLVLPWKEQDPTPHRPTTRHRRILAPEPVPLPAAVRA